ncbi:MAG: hypothetical protein KBB83_07395 [Alphaproteobacteria bacterium]|nr:hypothetical protein [Alphaproteobacteria bacterium]
MKNLLFGLVSLFLIPSVQLFSSDFRNDPKMQLMDGFADARKYVREASGEQCFEELRNFSTKDLKKDHIIDFHQAFKALTEPGHTLKEYQYNYFKALLLSGFIAKQMQNEHNQAKQQIVNHYSSIYQHLSLIQKQVRQPQTLLFENLFGYSGREDVLLCSLFLFAAE